ncbi:NAD(P)/FAD-dependent oxidoreductase [Alteromonas sp. BL110]|uniref:NAD(P)-binding protein n=1 Tax=Alteromonas sp. BL110 TaxID=1714845 RepID=UPI000E53EB0E|nr:NAD(P)-binding protein [Alteromonas sp. BL110]AXT38169.1 NAD(P)/FAD-dependent oxidoreductase [Alteromonas sp. BL110]RKM80913.1 NAD(P)/FAD-dependent oxidoreductase [Alteromonas sp. BL110]
MKTEQLTCDYLIVGAGAVGMAFADVLLHETDANILIIDKNAKPGGHWNYAYPFVTLHQPSAFYGVCSKELNRGIIDKCGMNEGLMGLASGQEVSAYFDAVMNETFLPSGRVQYYPMCEYQGDKQFISLLNGKRYEVSVKKKIVDATYLNTSIPLTHTPSFSLDSDVDFTPVNTVVPRIGKHQNYVVIGGGKTGVDTCLWLLQNHVSPDNIHWVVSRDAWLLNRKNTQPLDSFFFDTIGAQANQMEAIASSSSIDDMFDKLEERGVLLRIDKDVRPSMFHGATVSELELSALQSLTSIVRHGRVTHISKDELHFNGATWRMPESSLVIDCSASAITNLDIKPVFDGDVITPQTVRAYQPVFSAALIAHVEAAYADEKQKQVLTQVVPLPNRDLDWLPMTAAMLRNMKVWGEDEGLRAWIYHCRLDGFSRIVHGVAKDDMQKMQVLGRLKEAAVPAMQKLMTYIHDLKAKGQL